MKKLLTPLITLLVIACIPGIIQAQAFKNSENDPLSYLRSLPRPNMLIIADTSGSMLYHISYDKSVRNTGTTYNLDADNLNSRIKNLKNALSAVVTSVDKVNFGLARFNNYTSTYNYISEPFTHTFVSQSSMPTVYHNCKREDTTSAYPMDYTDCFWTTVSSNPIYKDNKRYARDTYRTAVVGETLTLHHYNSVTASPYPGLTRSASYTFNKTTRTLTYYIAYPNVNTGSICDGLYMTTVSGQPAVTVDIRNDYTDDALTPVDEADNLPEIISATGTWEKEGSLVPGGSTPLYASLGDAQTYFTTTIIPRDNAYPDIQACRKNYIVLITDGDETCYGDTWAFTTKARDLYNNYGIKTFAIGLSVNDMQYVNRCADYGDDGVYNNSSTAYACTDTDSIVDAFQDIVSKISDQLDSLAPPVVSTVYTHPYWDDNSLYAGELDASEAILVQPFFQFPSWRGHLLATWLYYIEYNSRIPDDPGTTEDERWVTYNFSPQDMWTAGYILSRANAPLADTNGDTYINELDDAVTNSGYKAADSRVVYTTNGNTGTLSLIDFDSTLTDKVDRLGLLDAEIPSIILPAWSADKTRRQYVDNTEVADAVINYIRGKKPIVDSSDSDSDGSTLDFQRDSYTGYLTYEEREWKLGDSVMSVAAIISEPAGYYKKKFFSSEYILPTEQTFEEFQDEYADRPNVVLYGTSDGIMHCFALKDISASTTFGPSGAYSPPKDYIAGEEIWAFVPGDPDVMQKLKWLVMDYNGDGEIDGQIYAQRQSWRDASAYEWMHWYYLDGPVRFSNVFIDEDGNGVREWKTIALIGEGRGGRYYYAFDMTNPFEPRLMWKFPSGSADSTNMGVTLSTPAIAYQSVPSGGYRWLAIFGAGYDAEENASNDVGQYIYALDVADGSIVYSFSEPATESGSKKSMVIAPPAVFNSQTGTDYIDDKVFVGDTDGRLWRIDLNTEVISKRLDFGTENQAIVAGVSAAHATGESVWWDLVFLGTGGDTRVADTIKYRLVGFIDESYNQPYAPAYATISSSATGDNQLPDPIDITDPIDSFEPSAYVFMHMETDTNERLDAQPTTNVVEATTYTKLQTFFTLFNPGSNPCIIGTSRLLEIDHYIDKDAGTLERTTLPSGTASGIIDLGEGKSGGTYISDGVVFAPVGSNMQMYGSPVPPPPPKGNKVVVNVLSWKVLSD